MTPGCPMPAGCPEKFGPILVAIMARFRGRLSTKWISTSAFEHYRRRMRQAMAMTRGWGRRRPDRWLGVVVVVIEVVYPFRVSRRDRMGSGRPNAITVGSGEQRSRRVAKKRGESSRSITRTGDYTDE